MKHIYDITITTAKDNIVETVIFGDSFDTRELAEKVIAALKKDNTYPTSTLDIVERNLLEDTSDLLASLLEE